MNKLLTLFVAIAALFMGCEQEIYHNIDKETWYLFNEGDTIYYLNNGIRADTFIVESIISGYDVNDKKYYYENLDIDFNFENTFFRRDYNSAKVVWLDFYAYLIYKNKTTTNYTINNFEFADVYFCDETFFDNTSDLGSIYYSDLYGVIAYELYNGEVYEIDVNCFPEKTK